MSIGIIFLTCSIIIMSAGCVKFETGQSAKEEKVSQHNRAKRIRSEFAARVQGGTKQEVARTLVQTVEAINAQYLDFGRRVGDQWQEGNKGRGQDIPAAEMITVVNAWTEKEKPILQANEDNIEYAANYLNKEFLLQGEEQQFIDSLLASYYSVYNTVFYPSGILSDYLNEIDSQEAYGRQLIWEFSRLFDL